jgi:asparagine N-glycosylation enzyme membrane subunit Stt3
MMSIEKKINRFQKRKIIYIVIACALILINVFADVIGVLEGRFETTGNDVPSSIGFFIGSQIFILMGLLLFYRVHKMNRRIKELQQLQINEIIDHIGE